MLGTSFVEVRQMKNGKWRLYKHVSQAVMSWRGENDKATVVREERCNEFNWGLILNFDSKEDAESYSQQVLGTRPFLCND